MSRFIDVMADIQDRTDAIWHDLKNNPEKDCMPEVIQLLALIMQLDHYEIVDAGEVGTLEIDNIEANA